MDVNHNFSILPKDRRTSKELDTRCCAFLDLVVTLVSNGAQHLIESTRRDVFLFFGGLSAVWWLDDTPPVHCVFCCSGF